MKFYPRYKVNWYSHEDFENGDFIQGLQRVTGAVDTGGCCIENRKEVFTKRSPLKRVGKFPFRKWVEKRNPVSFEVDVIRVYTGGGSYIDYVEKLPDHFVDGQ